MPGEEFFTGRFSIEKTRREIKYHRALMQDIATGHLPIIIPPELQAPSRVFDTTEIIEAGLKNYEESLRQSANP